MTGRDRAPARPPAISSPAVASARADLHRAKQQLTELNVRLSLIAEQIHAGKVLLKTIRHDLIAAKRRSERTRVAAERAVDELDATVRRAYEGVGTTEGLAALAAQHRLISSLDDRLKREIAEAVSDRRTTPPPSTDSEVGTSGSGSGGGTPGQPPPPGPPPPPENRVDELIYSIWGHNAAGAVAECIADHESRDNPNARNSSTGAAGLFQLMPFWWDGNNAFGWRFDPYDPEENAKHAFLIWKRDGWNPWTTKYLCT